MKKLLFLIVLVGVMVLPFKVNAEDYTSLNFKEVLKEEEIDLKNNSYTETDDQVTIYLFRGKGCSYCRGFLNFLNDNSKELGKYFKVVSYEVWKDEANASLLDKVSEYLGQPADGVPYIVIGDQVFAGFTEEAYGEKVKTTIMDLYNTEKSERYDVFEQMQINPDNTDSSKETAGSKSNKSNLVSLLLNLLFITIGTISIIVYNSVNFKKLSEQIKKSK